MSLEAAEDDTEPCDLTTGAFGVCLAGGRCVFLACPGCGSNGVDCSLGDDHTHACFDCGWFHLESVALADAVLAALPGLEAT